MRTHIDRTANYRHAGILHELGRYGRHDRRGALVPAEFIAADCRIDHECRIVAHGAARIDADGITRADTRTIKHTMRAAKCAGRVFIRARNPAGRSDGALGSKREAGLYTPAVDAGVKVYIPPYVTVRCHWAANDRAKGVV